MAEITSHAGFTDTVVRGASRPAPADPTANLAPPGKDNVAVLSQGLNNFVNAVNRTGPGLMKARREEIVQEELAKLNAMSLEAARNLYINEYELGQQKKELIQAEAAATPQHLKGSEMFRQMLHLEHISNRIFNDKVLREIDERTREFEDPDSAITPDDIPNKITAIFNKHFPEGGYAREHATKLFIPKRDQLVREIMKNRRENNVTRTSTDAQNAMVSSFASLLDITTETGPLRDTSMTGRFNDQTIPGVTGAANTIYAMDGGTGRPEYRAALKFTVDTRLERAVHQGSMDDVQEVALLITLAQGQQGTGSVLDLGKDSRVFWETLNLKVAESEDRIRRSKRAFGSDRDSRNKQLSIAALWISNNPETAKKALERDKEALTELATAMGLEPDGNQFVSFMGGIGTYDGHSFGDTYSKMTEPPELSEDNRNILLSRLNAELNSELHESIAIKFLTEEAGWSKERAWSAWTAGNLGKGVANLRGDSTKINTEMSSSGIIGGYVSTEIGEALGNVVKGDIQRGEGPLRDIEIYPSAVIHQAIMEIASRDGKRALVEAVQAARALASETGEPFIFSKVLSAVRQDFAGTGTETYVKNMFKVRVHKDDAGVEMEHSYYDIGALRDLGVTHTVIEEAEKWNNNKHNALVDAYNPSAERERIGDLIESTRQTKRVLIQDEVPWHTGEGKGGKRTWSQTVGAANHNISKDGEPVRREMLKLHSWTAGEDVVPFLVDYGTMKPRMIGAVLRAPYLKSGPGMGPSNEAIEALIEKSPEGLRKGFVLIGSIAMSAPFGVDWLQGDVPTHILGHVSTDGVVNPFEQQTFFNENVEVKENWKAAAPDPLLTHQYMVLASTSGELAKLVQQHVEDRRAKKEGTPDWPVDSRGLRLDNTKINRDTSILITSPQKFLVDLKEIREAPEGDPPAENNIVKDWENWKSLDTGVTKTLSDFYLWQGGALQLMFGTAWGNSVNRILEAPVGK